MPRRISGSSATRPSQVNSAQSSDNPVTPTTAEQSSSSQSSGSSSSHAGRAQEKGKAARLIAQMREANRLENQEWNKKLSEGACLPLVRLSKNFGDTLLLLSKEDYAWKNNLNSTEDEQTHEQCLEEGKPIMEKLEKVKSDYEKEWAEISGKVISIIESYDSLPDATKSRLNVNGLEGGVKDAKAAYMNCKWMKLYASVAVIRASDHRAQGKCALLESKCMELIQKMSDENSHSDRMQNIFEELSSKCSQLSKYSKAHVAEGMKIIEDCDKVLAHPYINEGPKDGIKNHLSVTRCLISHLHLCATESACLKLRMSMEFAMFGNGGGQENENLLKWHELTSCFTNEEYTPILIMNHRLIMEEICEMKEQSANQLTQDKLLIRQEAARDAQNKIEKIIRGYKKRLEEYDNLDGVKKNDRVRSSLQELTDVATELFRSREYAEQFWSDKIKNLENRNNSFLPSTMRSKPSRQSTDKRTSSLPQNASPDSSRKDDFHITMEGVAFGRINEKGELDSLDNSGNVIASYFMDQDGGKWVKDYGDELDLEQQALSTAPAASSNETAAHEKTERLVQKAGNIVETSMRFSAKVMNDIEAGNDHDDKIGLLQRAYSEKAKAIAKIKNLLVELKELSTQGQSGQNPSTTLDDHLKRLQVHKNDLGKQLQQAQQAFNHHSHKRRDPTEGNFKFLWEQGQVASIVKEFNRQQNRNNANDWLDRYVISFAQGTQGEEYEPWIVHAHYNSRAASAAPVRVHMKRNAERDWGVEQQAYHSLPLSEATFNLVKQEVQKQEAPLVKKGSRKKR